MLSLLLGLAAHAAPIPDHFRGTDIVGGDFVERLEVLAVDGQKQKLAWKVLYKTSFDAQPPHDCHYAGMAALPGVGVKLGLWDLATSSNMNEFVVYESVMEAEDCTDFAKSEERLAAAKAAFAAAGLDISSKPTPMEIPSDGKLTWPGGATATVRSTEPMPVASEEESEQDAMAADEHYRGIAVERNGKQLYARNRRYSSIMAGSLSAWTTQAWPVDDGLVLLERWAYGNMRGGSLNFTFSPVLPPK